MRRSEFNRVGWLVVGTLLSTLAWSCHRAPWLILAHQGSLAELKKSVDEGRRNHAFQRESVEDLARAILEREIQSSTDPEGEALVGRLRDCARLIEVPLRRRARRNDETAGAALLTLVEQGRHLPNSDWIEALNSSSGSRRAAAAVDSQASERWAAREKLLMDPDLRVRSAALRSVILAPAPAHWDNIVAILRRDPDPGCRQLAAQAIGVLGGPQASTVLSDAWARADRPLRLAIVSGWAQAPTFSAGGRQRLVATARSEPGIVGVLAAADLAQGQSDARSHGQARITRSLEFGSTEDRPLAASAADWALPEQAELLLRLGLRAEPETRVVALQRWLERPAHRWLSVTWLRSLAEGDDTPALSARAALAQFGDPWVVSSLRAQLRYAKAESRAHAVRSLWLLDDMDGLATALTDDAPEVRMTAACMAIQSRRLP